MRLMGSGGVQPLNRKYLYWYRIFFKIDGREKLTD